MDNNDSAKPQQTGGLKLMTVFIAVLALHVLVIGGFTVYHLMGNGNDADVAADKNHKAKADGTMITDVTAPDAAPDKSADATTPAATDTASTTGTATAPAATPETTTPADAPAPAMATTTAAPATEPAHSPNVATTTATPAEPAPIVIPSDNGASQSGAPSLAPPPEPTAVTIAPAPVPSAAPAATVATTAPVQAPAPSLSHDSLAPAPSIAPVPVRESDTISAATPSGPIVPSSRLTSAGPVHMPAIAPKPAASHAMASAEEHVSAPTHETKKEFYTVKITDSYKKIAESHHVTVAQLKSTNHIKDNVLHAGQKLVIPGAKTSVAKSERTHESGVIASTAALSASPEPSVTEHHHHFYTVAKGDTLRKIAKRFNVSTSALKEVNNMSDTKVAVGEKLRIPVKETHRTASAPSAPIRPIQVESRPSQVEAQPAPIEQQAPTPTAVPVPEPQPRTPPSPELANMTF